MTKTTTVTPATKTETPARRMNIQKPADKTAAKPAKADAKNFAQQMVDALSKKPETKPVPARSVGKAKNKPDAKAETPPATPEVETKTAKVKPLVEPFVSRKPAKGKVMFVIENNTRGQRCVGRVLFAHTHAVLSTLGMLSPACPAVPKSALLTFLGQRAVDYHLSPGQRNLESKPDGSVSLTQSGYNNFMNRLTSGKFDPKVANAFVKLMIDGIADPETGIAQGKVYQTAFAL